VETFVPLLNLNAHFSNESSVAKLLAELDLEDGHPEE
jgi:hypothetical protein